MRDETLEQRLKRINLKGYPEWYRPKLEKAIRMLGAKWQLHPANQTYRKAA